MSGRILIVDSIATNRILLRAMLQASHYEVTPCASIAEAASHIAVNQPDLLMLDVCQEPDAALALCHRIRGDAELSEIPIIATLSGQPYCRHAPSRIAALRAGVNDVIDKSAPDTFLQARIRSLLRARHAAAELLLREAGEPAAGFAESADSFAGPGTVAVVAPGGIAGPQALRMVLDRLPVPARMIDPGVDMSDAAIGTVPDLFVIDGLWLGDSPAEVFRLLSDLRSRSATRHAATLVILPAASPEMGALALDLGATDVVTDLICADELAHRIRQLIRQKTLEDRRRDNMQSRLQAAIIDPLTGLHNRRHAIPRLERMVWAAHGTGQDFAVMMLDIDFFKAINDTHGHAAGDRVLVEVAARLRENLRAIDLISRIGGEEFLVAMPDTTLEQARGAAERLRRVIEGAPFDKEAALAAGNAAMPSPAQPLRRTADIHVTISIGVALGLPPGPEVPDVDAAVAGLFDRADKALYAAKTAGRNNVTVACNAA